MTNIYVAGIAMTVFGRHPERSLDDLAREALDGALTDAGCAADDLGIAFYSGMTNGPLQGQLSIPGQVVFAKIGIEGIPIYNVENACASGSSAFNLAVQSLKAGTTDVALALGAEKMNIPDKLKALSLFEAGWDVSRAEENYRMLVTMGEGIEAPPGSESDKPYSRFMAIYAAMCRHHMKTYGTTQRQIAAVSAKNHAHSVHNPYSQFRKPFTIDEILAAPPITYPLTLPMCAPLSDGSAAAILCTEDGLERIGADRSAASRWPRAWFAASRIAVSTSRSKASAVVPPVRRTSRQASGPRTCTLPRCTTHRPWGRSFRLRTWASSHWAKAGRQRNATNSPSADACRSILPAASNRRATRSALPVSVNSTSSSRNCAAKPAHARRAVRVTPFRKMAAACRVSRKPPLPFTFSPGDLIMFKDKVVVVTGAASGIGRALAVQLAQAGARVAASDINRAGLDETLRIIEGKGAAKGYIVDASSADAVFAHADEVKRDFGTAHFVFNNAGASLFGTVANTTIEEFEWQIRLNMWGVLYGTKAFLPMMLAQREGCIVNISSVFGLLGYPGQGAYTMSKFAVRGLTECLWAELDGTGVRAVCVHPGGIKTNLEAAARRVKAAGAVEAALSETAQKTLTTTPEVCAADILDGIRRGRKRIVTGNKSTTMFWLSRMFPSAYPSILKRLV